jgi:predicted RNA-binding protein with PUA-like domain
MKWLLKSEPDVYSWDDLVKDKKAVWDGINNNAALKHMRDMKKGELCLIYHTGDEKQAVGIAEITSTAYPDPKLEEERRLVFDIKPKKKLKNPVTIADIKADPFFNDWLFVKIGRLSVVPVTDEQWEKIIKMSEK